MTALTWAVMSSFPLMSIQRFLALVVGVGVDSVAHHVEPYADGLILKNTAMVCTGQSKAVSRR